MLAFEPLEPEYTAGQRLQSISIHVRDHKLRELTVTDRTAEAHYESFVFSQVRKTADEARRLALSVPYGRDGNDAQVAGCAARMYELGPEVPPGDIDGRSPSVVVWHDGEMLYLIASGEMSAFELSRIASSLYERSTC
jgi:hypothetical protein